MCGVCFISSFSSRTKNNIRSTSKLYFTFEYQFLSPLGLTFIEITIVSAGGSVLFILVATLVAILLKRNGKYSKHLVFYLRFATPGQGARQAGALACPVSVALIHQEYFYSPLDKMLVYRRVTPNIKFCGPLFVHLASVAKKVDNAIQRINRYPVGKCWRNELCYSLDSAGFIRSE